MHNNNSNIERIVHTAYTIEAPTTLINQYPNLVALNWKKHTVKGNVVVLRDIDKEYINDIADILKRNGIPFTKGEL